MDQFVTLTISIVHVYNMPSVHLVQY